MPQDYSYIEQPSRQDRPSTSMPSSPNRPSSSLVQEPYPTPPSAMPYNPNSWEGMTNVEKFNELRTQLQLFNKSLDELSLKLCKLRDSFAEHVHAPSGQVVVQYNRDRF